MSTLVVVYNVNDTIVGFNTEEDMQVTFTIVLLVRACIMYAKHTSFSSTLDYIHVYEVGRENN